MKNKFSIIVKNLPCDIDKRILKKKLRKIFSTHGNIINLAIHNYVAIVTYQDETSCKVAVEKENGKIFYSKTLEIIHNKPVKLASSYISIPKELNIVNSNPNCRI